MTEKYEITQDSLIIVRDGKPIARFRIKGGIYGDLHSVRREERNREFDREGDAINYTEVLYHGSEVDNYYPY